MTNFAWTFVGSASLILAGCSEPSSSPPGSCVASPDSGSSIPVCYDFTTASNSTLNGNSVTCNLASGTYYSQPCPTNYIGSCDNVPYVIFGGTYTFTIGSSQTERYYAPLTLQQAQALCAGTSTVTANADGGFTFQDGGSFNVEAGTFQPN